MKLFKKIFKALDYWTNQLALLAFLAMFIITQTIAFKIFTIEKKKQYKIGTRKLYLFYIKL